MSPGSIPRPRKTNARHRTTSAAAAPCHCEPLERRLCLAITFASPTTYSLPSGTFTGTDFALGDFNRDGRTDAVMSYYGTSQPSGTAEGGLVVFPNAGGGLLGAPVRNAFGALSTNMRIAAGDFNGDANPDVAMAVSFAPPAVAVIRGDGANGFTIQGAQQMLGGPTDILSGDFNADQLPDAVVANGNNVSVFPGGAGAGVGAGLHQPLAPNSNPWAIASADFNADGKPDLAVANAGTSDVTVLLGSGAGSFGSKPPIPISVRPQVFVHEIVSGDFNGDAKADLLVGLTDGDVRVLLGAGDGSFQMHPQFINTGATAPSFVVGDFDGDNRHDLVAAGAQNGGVRVLRGLGNGTFDPPELIGQFPTASAPIAAAVADFDANGKLDVALAHPSAAVSVLLNTSPPADATPPSPHLEASNLTQAGRYLATVDVVFTDNVAVNPSTVGAGDITVTGPNGFSENSHIFTTTAVSGSQLRAKYHFNFPASGWTAAANGTYTVTLNPNRVKDTGGNAAAGGSLGTFQVNIPFDNTPPQTTLVSAQDVTIGGGSEYRLSVLHSDNIALPSVIGEGAVVVRTPGGASLSQGFIPRVYPPPGSPVPYDYAYAAPGGTWDPTDNGTYTIELLPNALFDTSGNAALPRTLGTFRVNVPTGGTASITATVYDDANADGVQGAGEGPLSFQQVYLDLNNNGAPDGGDPKKFTNGSGIATFPDLPAGNYALRAIPSDSSLFPQFQTSPAAEHRITLAPGAAATRSFGLSTLPGVRGVEFLYQSAPHAIKITFNRNVSASFGMEDVSVVNLTTAQTVFPTGYRYDPVESGKNLYETATFTFAGVLPDGNYRVTLNKPGVTDAQGRPLAGNNIFDFFVLAADANRDRTVNFDDLAILAQHYNTTGGMTFVKGDFNYDNNVNFDDLALLAQRYNTTLPPPPPPAPAPAPATPFSPARPIARPKPATTRPPSF